MFIGSLQSLTTRIIESLNHESIKLINNYYNAHARVFALGIYKTAALRTSDFASDGIRSH
jgi:hypothetical protein